MDRTISYVTYARAKDMTKEQKKELGLDENLEKGLVAIEGYIENGKLVRRGVLVDRGVVDYILNGKREKQKDSKEIRKKIEDLTILIATAKEEGDEDKHKQVVDEIMNLFNQERDRIINIIDKWFEIPENPENKKFRCDYLDVLKLKEEIKNDN